jgi:hypothetical protein
MFVRRSWMKNVTLSADEELIELAREKAREENTTLNEQFRRWLEDYVGRAGRAQRAMATIEDLQKRIRLKGPFPRDVLNER